MQGLLQGKQLLWKACGKSDSITASPRAVWPGPAGTTAEAGSLQAMGRFAGLEDFFPSPPGFPRGPSLKTWWVSRGLERRQGLFPRESLGSERNQEGSELPSSGARFLPWFSFPFHKYEHHRAEGIFWSRQQNEENISLKPTVLQPPMCPTSEKKKVLCTEGKGGKRFYFPSQ